MSSTNQSPERRRRARSMWHRLPAGEPTCLFTAFVISLFGTVQVPAQPEQSKLDTLLDRISFNNAERPETLGQELASLSKTELAKLCDMLVEPGTGDDTKARIALQGLTWYLGSEGTRAQRDRYVDALCTALDSDRPSAVKAFLIQQLQLVGDDRATASLADFLHDEKLCQPAAQALLAIGGEKAAKIFRTALPNAGGQRRIAIIDALGLLKDRHSVVRLREEAKSEDREIKLAACAALANIGDDSLTGALQELGEVDSWYEQSKANAYLSQLAERLGLADWVPVLSRQSRSKEPPPHLVCAALYVLAKVEGIGAVDRLITALAADDPETRAAATNIAVALQGEDVTEKCVRALETASTEARVGIVNVLAQRGDKSALPAIFAAFEDVTEVRIAAIRACRQIGGEEVIEPLAEHLSTESESERKAVEDVLVGLSGESITARLAVALDSAPPRVQCSLLNVLARRRARSQVNTALAFINSDDEPVQIAAIDAVGVLADQTAAPPLLALLRQTETESVREAIEAALATTCNRAESPESRAAPILAAIHVDDVRNYCSLLRVLGHIGGKPTVPTFRSAVADSREEVKETAIRALADWPNPTILDTALVLTFAHDAQELKHHVLAMRAFADFLARTADEDVETTLGLFKVAMQEATRRDEERKLLLSKLAGIHDQMVLDTLAGYLSSEALGAEAAAATISVAEGMLPDGWWPARAALEKVLDTVEGEALRGRAQEVLDQIAEYEDFITDWLVSGPYAEPGKDGRAIFDIAFPPELPDVKDLEWKRQPRSPGPERWWHIDLARSIGGDHRAAYLRTHVWSPTTQEVVLELGSDDGIKVWLNGELIHANNVPRGCARGQDKVPTTLREGKNTLLMKVCNIGGGWGACARFRTPEGKRLRDLRIDAEARP